MPNVDPTPLPGHDAVHTTDETVAGLRRELVRLRAATAGLGLAMAAAFIMGAGGGPGGQEVLRVERLEIVEPDGSLAFVLSGSAHPAVATIDGVPILAGQEEERRNPAFIFFDGKGDEVGGMLFRNESGPEGNSALRHFSLDGYKQDQTVVLHHYQGPGGSHAGLSVTDRPTDVTLPEAFRRMGVEMPATRQAMNEAIGRIPEEERGALLGELFGGANRVFVGTLPDGTAILRLRDPEGRARVEIGVPAGGSPYLRILEEDGSLQWEAAGPAPG